MPDRLAAPRRHDLVWLEPLAAGDARTVSLGCLPDAEARGLLADWLERGHPLIVSRQPEMAEGLLALGLALPPSLGKHRLPFQVPVCHVRRSAAPPRLADLASALPESWLSLIGALLASPALAAVCPRVLGSAGMQAVTLEPCLGEASDLDLLLAAPDWPAAEAALLALEAITDASPLPRLDGELCSPDGFAAAWREVAASPARLLVKGLHSVTMEAMADYRGRFFTSVGLPAA
ncbi:MAG: malonate decarboxylase holo-[acyl-carrier-protein] synthase [Rhodocyclaceae bacterium]|nr:malonate decarboxylase holo-[acyl-carrier-protein] synthase [Rhodocyclaceae bacterium]